MGRYQRGSRCWCALALHARATKSVTAHGTDKKTRGRHPRARLCHLVSFVHVCGDRLEVLCCEVLGSSSLPPDGLGEQAVHQLERRGGRGGRGESQDRVCGCAAALAPISGHWRLIPATRAHARSLPPISVQPRPFRATAAFFRSRAPTSSHLICVSPNGGREVSVDRLSQPTVRPLLWGQRARPEIARRRDAARGHQPNYVVEVRVARLAGGGQGAGEICRGASVEGDALPAEGALQRRKVVVLRWRVKTQHGL
eukprot:scaffold15054_cov96-Isochrysis_galbana.AAC.2